MRLIITSLLIILIIIFAYQLNKFLRLERIGKKMSSITSPFERHVADPTKRILIIGDSLAVGVGTSGGAKSIAGLIASDYPELDITNLAVSGSKVKDVLATLQNAGDDKYDIILIQTGGNDVVQFTSIDDAAADLDALLKLAKKKSDKVLFFSSGSVGFAPIFIAPVSWIYTNRTVNLYSKLKTVAEENSVTYIDLLYSKADDPFKDIEKYYAPDYFHVSDPAYEFWYQKIKLNLQSI